MGVPVVSALILRNDVVASLFALCFGLSVSADGCFVLPCVMLGRSAPRMHRKRTASGSSS